MHRIGPEARVVVFAKAPEPGRVKTRLIPLLGEAGAAALHARLVRHALGVATHGRTAAVYLYGAPDAGHVFFRECAGAHGVTVRQQATGDVGQRMRAAFEETLQEAQHVILIGSDCPSLTADHLGTAQRALRDGCDAAFAPAEDGGYGLVALRQCAPELFDGIAWSEPTVMHETRTRLQRLGWRWREIATIWDVDRPADYERLMRSDLLAAMPQPIASHLISQGTGPT